MSNKFSADTIILGTGIISILGNSIYLNNNRILDINDYNYLNNLTNNITYTTGRQNISGFKTFLNSGLYSLNNAVGVSLPNNSLSIVASGDFYSQVSIQNMASGAAASADLVITSNLGNDTNNFINLGINNQLYSQTGFSLVNANDGYLYTNGGNLAIGTQISGTSILLHAGGCNISNLVGTINNSGINLISGEDYFINNNSTSTFSKGGAFYNYDGIPSGSQTIPLWQSTYPCRVLSVRGNIISGTSALVNAVRNNAQTILPTNLNISTTGTWFSSGNVQNSIFNSGDSLSIRLVQNVGNPVSVSIQVDMIRT